MYDCEKSGIYEHFTAYLKQKVLHVDTIYDCLFATRDYIQEEILTVPFSSLLTCFVAEHLPDLKYTNKFCSKDKHNQ